jgi:hypothetical protein
MKERIEAARRSVRVPVPTRAFTQVWLLPSKRRLHSPNERRHTKQITDHTSSGVNSRRRNEYGAAPMCTVAAPMGYVVASVASPPPATSTGSPCKQQTGENVLAHVFAHSFPHHAPTFCSSSIAGSVLGESKAGSCPKSTTNAGKNTNAPTNARRHTRHGGSKAGAVCGRCVKKVCGALRGRLWMCVCGSLFFCAVCGLLCVGVWGARRSLGAVCGVWVGVWGAQRAP